MPASKPFNPFYGLLLVVGIAFCVTACAYGVMTVRAMPPPPGTLESIDSSSVSSPSGEKLMSLMDEHGFKLLMTELVALAFLTFAAIGTDEYWTRRATKKSLAKPGAPDGGTELMHEGTPK